MQYFFVNHSQTFQDEIGDGYLWSPKTKQNGNINWSYDNMKKVKPGDLVFSFAQTEVKAIGYATSEAYTAPKPDGFSEIWNKTGWKVDVDFEYLKHPFRLKEHLNEFKPFLPEKYSPISLNNGNGNQGCYLAHIPNKFAAYLIDKSGVVEEIEAGTIVENYEESRTTERSATVAQRVGQNIFKRRLIQKYGARCQLTGIAIPELLRASHIKPWSDSNNNERLNPNNGLLLIGDVDILFDRGLITFDDDGNVLFAKKEIKNYFDQRNLPRRINNIPAEAKTYLSFHREKIFKIKSHN